ncbi:hypothetical protein D039_3966B, partial [Vibrio parahaemolyticus EKP-028]
HTTWVERANSF